MTRDRKIYGFQNHNELQLFDILNNFSHIFNGSTWNIKHSLIAIAICDAVMYFRHPPLDALFYPYQFSAASSNFWTCIRLTLTLPRFALKLS